MITARLHSHPPSSELLIECYRQIREEGRAESASLLKQARKRAKAYGRHARLVGHNAGLAQGEQESRARYGELLERLEATHQDALRAAQRDALLQAYQVVESLFADFMTLTPAILERWIQLAIERIPDSIGLTLEYHPQYEEILNRFHTSLSSNIQIRKCSSLGLTDFRLRTELGSIECSWRDFLRAHASPRITVGER